MTGKLHVAVLMGGWSNEREVSLMSGNGVADALEKNGHQVSRVDMDRNVAMVLQNIRPDVVFNALHGVPGEDGTVQGMLDLMQIPYTHSGMATSVIAIDKELTKQQLVPDGIPMPKGTIISSASLYEADPLPRDRGRRRHAQLRALVARARQVRRLHAALGRRAAPAHRRSL